MRGPLVCVFVCILGGSTLALEYGHCGRPGTPLMLAINGFFVGMFTGTYSKHVSWLDPNSAPLLLGLLSSGLCRLCCSKFNRQKAGH